MEVYSVLTRLPEPNRLRAEVVRRLIHAAFPEPYVAPTADELRDALDRLVVAGVSGGATYDGLIGLAADQANAELVTLDRRALATYERLGIRVALV